MSALLIDRHGRRKGKLRVSLTDRCDFQCVYCMPERPRWRPAERLIRAPELHRLVGLMVRRLGIQALRLTGGEPLLREDLEGLIADLAPLRAQGLQRISLTTNAARLAGRARALRAAGLDDLNISLDAVDDAVFRRLSGGHPVAPVLAGIEAAVAAGLPVKLNMVVMRGLNQEQLLPTARWAFERGLPLRLIEFMPLDGRGGWSADQVVGEAELIEALSRHYTVQALPEDAAPAREYRLDGEHRLGVISTISNPFCTRCDRIRLAADGRLYSCLFAAGGPDLLGALREGADDDALEALIRDTVRDKPAGYIARPGYVERPITMHGLGG
ncbi:MAG TPA: GTP 3',8-cyclase MoaA [Nevskiaceae bacterium]|nr:GTP 3',8-cyclase MoaA [Nevskiaceae bacterium]